MRKLNVIANKVATKAVAEARCSEPEWDESIGLMLKIDRKVMTKKEGLMLSIDAEEKELHEWQ